MSSGNERALVSTAGILLDRLGLQIDAGDSGRLARCVLAAARDRDMNVSDYIAQLDSHPVALQDLINRVTVQESAFFRDRAQFDALTDFVLPALKRPATIWSAACANGQEAYSVAMVLDESGDPDSRVIATDISTQALARTLRAHYSRTEIEGLSARRRHRYLTVADGGFGIDPKLRARVDIGYHNLARDAPPFAAGACTIVLCRNVLIYFSREEVVRFVERLADWMAPGGWLFLGYSETLSEASERFELVRVGDAFLYRRTATRTNSTRTRTADKSIRKEGKSPPTTTRERASYATRRTPPSAQVTIPPIDRVEIEARDRAAAVTECRKYAYLNPLQPIAHLHLGFALEASGDATAAWRAYAAARAALDSSEYASVEASLEGYQVDELARLLDAKLAGAR